MTKRILATVLIATVLFQPVSAITKGDGGQIITRYLKVNSPVKKLIIYGDADIIFVKNDAAQVSIQGKREAANKVRMYNVDGLMEIHSGKFYRGKKPVIRIPVEQLEFLEVHGDGDVSSEAVLKAKELNVFVAGHCEISIRTLGKVNFDSSPDIFINYKKQQTIVFLNSDLLDKL